MLTLYNYNYFTYSVYLVYCPIMNKTVTITDFFFASAASDRLAQRAKEDRGNKRWTIYVNG